MKEAIDNFKERNCILGSGHAFGVKPNVLWYGNHLGPFSGALAQSECQEQGEGSVGGPGWLHGVNLQIEFWSCEILDFGSKLKALGMGIHLRPFSGTLIWRWRTGWSSWPVGGQGQPQGEKLSIWFWTETWFLCQTKFFGMKNLGKMRRISCSIVQFYMVILDNPLNVLTLLRWALPIYVFTHPGRPPAMTSLTQDAPPLYV